MKQLNGESENIQKKPIQTAIQAGIDRAAEISRKRKTGEIRFPKGVFRFKTLEEADEWERKILAGEQPPKNSFGT